MSSPTLPLFTRSLRGWISAKGAWLLAAAILFPAVFAGVWVGTHRADVTVGGIEFDASELRDGAQAHFEATVTNVGPIPVGEFISNIQIAAPVREGIFRTVSANQTTIESLAPGESRRIALDWNATGGVYLVVVTGDTTATINEVEDQNNQDYTAISVAFDEPAANTAPNAPADIAGPLNGTAIADLAIVGLDVGAGFADTPRMASVTVENRGPDDAIDAEIVLRVGEHFGGEFVAPDSNMTRVDIPAGRSVNVTLAWAPSAGGHWAEAWVNSTNTTDPDASNNHATQALAANAFVPPGLHPNPPEEKATLKDYYKLVVGLYLTLIVPLVALFFAAGILTDERENRALTYIFTRPTPRWLFPLAKFAAGLIVTSIAVAIGLFVAFALLFTTTPQASEWGYLTTPLVASLVAVFAYGGVFTLLGVSTARPYLWGILLVLGWENAAKGLVPFAKYLTVSEHVGNVANAGFVAANLGSPDVLRALLIALGIGVGFLAWAVGTMKRRDLDV